MSEQSKEKQANEQAKSTKFIFEMEKRWNDSMKKIKKR